MSSNPFVNGSSLPENSARAFQLDPDGPYVKLSEAQSRLFSTDNHCLEMVTITQQGKVAVECERSPFLNMTRRHLASDTEGPKTAAMACSECFKHPRFLLHLVSLSDKCSELGCYSCGSPAQSHFPALYLVGFSDLQTYV